MEITNIIINISISFVVGGGAGFCVFKFFGKNWVNNWFAKDLKKYEQQLDLLKMQKQLQYSNVYVKRAEAIRDLYQNINDLSYEVKHFTDGCTDSQDYFDRLEVDHKNLIARIDKIERLFGIYKIYFSNATNIKINEYDDYLQTQRTKLERDIINGEDIPYNEFDYIALYEEFYQSLKSQFVNEMSEELISEFRKLIGVEQE